MESRQPDEAEILFAAVEQERANDYADEWRFRYGFEHDCTCGEDVEAGNIVEITRCFDGAVHHSFQELARARAFLYTIVTSPTEDANVLRQLASEGFQT